MGVYALLTASLGKGVYNTSGSQIRLETVPVKINSLPSTFRGLKIVQLSDIHSSLIVGRDHIAEAAELAMSQKPDVIVLTGDFISGKTKFGSGSVGKFERKYLDRCIEAFSFLKAPMGLYGVLGNHDFWSGDEAVTMITKEFERHLGVTWLRNRHVMLEKGKDRLALLGVDDYWETTCSLEKAYKGLDENQAKILLSHNPDINEVIHSSMKIDLILSGHTHGGQVVMPFIGMPFMPSPFGQKYREGLIRDRDQQTYITRGVGHLVAPVRYNCPPEVTLIKLV
jgi:predicted MPP superfamily phosphohydrolase